MGAFGQGAATRAPKLRVEGVSLRFASGKGAGVEVMRDVSLDVADGEFLSILGPSGCGKTSLARIIDGLIVPQQGRVLIDGAPIAGPGPDRAFVFQSDRLFPWRTVRANIRFGLEVRGIPARESRPRTDELLELTGLTGFAEAYPHQLSGGMRQRANLARALIVDPAVLLMDEPFASLDAQTREVMQQELLRIWSDRRKTVVFITHQLDEAVYLSDRVIVMSARPGQVKDSFAVQIPRPRALDCKRTPQFAGYLDRIWGVLEEEVRRSMRLTAAISAS
ncbi:MAG TPA: ABC transporter ATP-binding protein [Candidatus Limnocylindria bacterium]|nr:ABC transporter ATP-binding protein [Candidatus Limnocylindria bacterium]